MAIDVQKALTPKHRHAKVVLLRWHGSLCYEDIYCGTCKKLLSHQLRAVDGTNLAGATPVQVSGEALTLEHLERGVEALEDNEHMNRISEGMLRIYRENAQSELIEQFHVPASMIAA